MTSDNVDFTKYFQHKTLPRIYGEPDYHQLKKLKDALKANAGSIQSDLGGGVHGHLGQVLTPAEYTNVSAIAYVDPPNPGVLVVPPGITARQETGIREDHKRDLIPIV